MQLFLFDLEQLGLICEWETTFETRDVESHPLFFHIQVRCKKAMIKKNVAGFVVDVLEAVGYEEREIGEEIVSYGNSFFKQKDALEDYSFCIRQVHKHWRIIGKSRVKVLKEAEFEEWYECCFCGFMALEFFGTCRGCGMRFFAL